jgi:hypothetical protein
VVVTAPLHCVRAAYRYQIIGWRGPMRSAAEVHQHVHVTSSSQQAHLKHTSPLERYFLLYRYAVIPSNAR